MTFLRNVVAHFNYSSKPKFNEQISETRHEDVDESEVRHENKDDESEARLLDSESEAKRDNDDGP